MPLLNIFHVTETLNRLLKNGIENSPEWPSTDVLDVVNESPDQLKGDNVIGLYLYHLTEDAQYKNSAVAGFGDLPVRYTPMGLNLFYQVSAKSSAGVRREQLMMGLAVKALRDYPIIDRQTTIDETKILDDELAEDGDKIRIILQPVSHNEAVSFWTAGSSPLRLATYYQVSVILLEPERPKTRTGRVLSFGAYTFVGGTPRLDSAENVITFNPDPTSAGAPRQVTIQPAQVPLNGTVTFRGSNLGGDQITLTLRSPRWGESAYFVNDDSWNLTAFADRVQATVRATVSFTNPDRVDTIVPGIYSARIRARTYRTVSDGSIREFDHASNEIPFIVTPRVDGSDVLTPSATGDVLTLEGYGFEHPDLPADALEVRVGDEMLAHGTIGTLGAGEYAIDSTTVASSPLPDDPQTLNLVMPSGLDAGTLVPLRIFVNGAEAPPKWIQVPVS